MSNGQFIGVYTGEGAVYKPFAALFESALFRVPIPWKALDRSDLRNGRLLRHRHQIKALAQRAQVWPLPKGV